MHGRFFTLLAVALGLGACGQPQDRLADNDKLLPTICDVPYPSPVELSMAAGPLEVDGHLEKLLQRDLPEHGQVFEFSPDTQTIPVELKKGSYLPRRLFFVTQNDRPRTGSLWMVSGHFEGMPVESQIIATGLDPTVVAFITDSSKDAQQKQLELYRIAIVDRKTRFGPTFVSTNEQFRFVRYEHDSDYVRDEWEKGDCRGNPLTAIPPEWERRGH